MFSKFAWSLAAGLALTAFTAPVPSTTDEARALTGPRAAPECPAPPAAQAPSSTDEARALAAATIDRAPPSPSPERAPALVAGTDDARAVAAAAVDEQPALRACAAPAPGGHA
jgi:hypothetical protein